MGGLIVYHWPEGLSSYWRIPVESMGCEVVPLAKGALIKHSSTKVRLLIGKPDSTIYGWSYPWTKRYALAHAVELVLLASGMQSYFPPHSTSLIYVADGPAESDLLGRLYASQTGLLIESLPAGRVGLKHWRRGNLRFGSGRRVQYWSGPAIHPVTGRARRFVAFGAGLRQARGGSESQISDAIGAAMSSAGAERLDVMRDLDLLVKPRRRQD